MIVYDQRCYLCCIQFPAIFGYSVALFYTASQRVTVLFKFTCNVQGSDSHSKILVAHAVYSFHFFAANELLRDYNSRQAQMDVSLRDAVKGNAQTHTERHCKAEKW